MDRINISQAIESVWELIETLEQVYWEAGEMAHKDSVFNCLQILNREYMELLKISVQDHHFDYEVISLSLQQLMPVLSELSAEANTICRRMATREQLNDHLTLFILAIGEACE